MTKVTVDKLQCIPLMHDHVIGDITDLTNPFQFKGSIDIPGDFPTSALVQSGWLYKVTTDVTDNDATKTNTGQSFEAGDEIAWNGTDWTELGSTELWDRTGTVLSPKNTGDDISATDGLFSGNVGIGTTSPSEKLEVDGNVKAKQVIAVGSSAIVYSGDFISTVTINGRVTTYTNDGTNYTSWTDGTNTWTPTYNVTTGLLEGVAVT